jgi:hypothetical protein
MEPSLKWENTRSKPAVSVRSQRTQSRTVTPRRADALLGSHICSGTGLTPATSAPGLGSPRPHLRRDWAHPSHICAGTGLTPATSAPGPGSAAGSVTHEKTLARGRTARWPSASGPGGDVGGVSAVLAQMWAG